MNRINSLKYESRNFEVYIEGIKAHVFDTPVLFDGIDETRMIYHPYISSYMITTITKRTEVIIKSLNADAVCNVRIQPESKQVEFKIEDKDIKFFIYPGDKICVTLNNKINNMIMIFANLPDENTVGEDVLYFGPGEHYITDNEQNIIYLKSNQTLHLADGAIVYGRIEAKNCENIKITGNGILCGSYTNGRWGEWLRPMVGSVDKVPRKVLTDFINCKNVKIENITLIDADEWNVRILRCENVDISGINIIGYQSNSDGVDICSTKNVTLRNSFIRTSDDCVVIKSQRGGGVAQNIKVLGCTLWADRASALEIGHEICCDIFDVRFSDIDILNQIEETYGYHAIDITNADEGNVYDIYYENIRIEDCRRLLGIRIREGRFSNRSGFLGNGTIHDIYFKDIYSDVDRAIFVSGRNEGAKVSNVSFKNLYIKGKKILNFDKFSFNPYTENIKINDVFSGYPDALKMKTLDIRSMCNMILGHNRGIYGLNHEDWITMNSGISILEGVPFEIIGQGYSEAGDYKRCVVPKQRIRIEVDTVLNTDFKASWLFFLHTGINILSEIDKILLKYHITYEDDTTEEIIIRNQNDCNEWNSWSLGGWQPMYKSIRMYIKPWKNPYPEKTIKKIEMFDGEVHDLGVLLSITYS